MIKLSDGCYVTPDEIESIRVGAFGLWVRTKDGIGHCHELSNAAGLLSKIGPEWELRLVPIRSKLPDPPPDRHSRDDPTDPLPEGVAQRDWLHGA